MKTLNNTTANQASKQVSDIQFWGDGDTFKLISKASSKKEGWMKSTKAMEIKGVGCVIQVSTQQVNKTGVRIFEKDEKGIQKIYEEQEEVYTSAVAEALTFVPNVRIKEIKENDKVISRKLVLI